MAKDPAGYDTIIAGGELLDPGSGLLGRLDVGITDGRVVEVAAGLDPAAADEVVDARGQIVTPGLVDLHTHAYWGATYWGVEPDPLAARTGVTTWVDAGSAGAYNLPGFRRYVAECSRARVVSLLNLSSIGLVAPTWELSNLDLCDVELAAGTVEANRDLVCGVKARIDRNTTRGVGVHPLRLARQLADRVGLPLMVHIGSGPPTLAEVLDLLRPGDILTHCFTAGDHRVIEHGAPRADVTALRDRGLVLDIGHGSGSFLYEQAEAALRHGLLPDVISSDIHQLSVHGPMYDLPTTLSKFLGLGLSLAEVVERATSRPAAAIGRPELGSLRPGSVADVALFRLEEGEHTFHDVRLAARRSPLRLVNTRTLVRGRALPALPEPEPAPWAAPASRQGAATAR